MTIDITPIVDLFINLFAFGVGLDFTWCGYLLLKTNKTTHLPRLLGYQIYKFVETGNKKNKSKNETANEIARIMFSPKAFSVYMLLGGVQLIIASALWLLSQLL
jgi:hypothetical protein